MCRTEKEPHCRLEYSEITYRLCFSSSRSSRKKPPIKPELAKYLSFSGIEPVNSRRSGSGWGISVPRQMTLLLMNPSNMARSARDDRQRFASGFSMSSRRLIGIPMRFWKESLPIPEYSYQCPANRPVRRMTGVVESFFIRRFCARVRRTQSQAQDLSCQSN